MRPLPRRDELVRGAIRWCSLSVLWAVLAGAIALAAGITSGSVALVGFGGDSFVDSAASAVLVWRFLQEGAAPHRVDRVEQMASRVVGVALLLVAGYLIVGACVSLVAETGPTKTMVGSLLAGVSLVVLPVLATRKLGLARKLQSRALRSDGVLSAAGGLLAATTLLGLVLTASVQWWWSDAAAALVIAAVLVREGSLSVIRRRPLSRTQ